MSICFWFIAYLIWLSIGLYTSVQIYGTLWTIVECNFIVENRGVVVVESIQNWKIDLETKHLTRK